MTSIWRQYTVREQDVEHIERLRVLKDEGHPMDTTDELKASLLDRFGDPEATETYEWATNSQSVGLYCSGVWTRDGVLDGNYPKTLSENSENDDYPKTEL